MELPFRMKIEEVIRATEDLRAGIKEEICLAVNGKTGFIDVEKQKTVTRYNAMWTTIRYN